MAKTIKIIKDGITRIIPQSEIYDYQRKGWKAEGQKPLADAAALAKDLAKTQAELDKAKAALAASEKAVKDLTAENAALKAELDKAKAGK